MYVAQPIEWTEKGVVMLDQRRLPAEEISFTYTDYREVAKAITEMVIRGAPAIGVAAAMGAALGVLHSKANSVEALRTEFAEICNTLAKTRPTAVDLFWALERMKAHLPNSQQKPQTSPKLNREWWRKQNSSTSKRKLLTKPSALLVRSSCPPKAK